MSVIRLEHSFAFVIVMFDENVNNWNHDTNMVISSPICFEEAMELLTKASTNQIRGNHQQHF